MAIKCHFHLRYDDGLIPTLVLTGVLQNAPRRARCPDNNSVVFSPQQKVKSRQCYFCSRNSQNTFIPIDFTVFKIRIKTFLLETLFNKIKEERKRDQYYIDFTLTVQNRAEQVLQILLRTKLDLTLSSILATVEEKKKLPERNLQQIQDQFSAVCLGSVIRKTK